MGHVRKWLGYVEMSLWDLFRTPGSAGSTSAIFLLRERCGMEGPGVLRGSGREAELLLLRTNVRDVYTPRKLFATSHRYKNTRINDAVYQIPLQQNRTVGFLIAEG